MTATRTDVHRVAAIVPADYAPLLCYALPGIGGDPGYNLALLAAARTGEPQQERTWTFDERTGRVVPGGWVTVRSPWGKVPFFGETTGRCDCCGASFRYGEVWRHRASGEAIHLGHQCAAKYNLTMDVSQLERHKERVAKMMKGRRETAARRAATRLWARANWALLPLLRVDHDIARSMRLKLIQTGCKWGLSEKQIALLRTLKERIDNPPAPEKKTRAPVGRLLVRGVIQKVDSRPGYTSWSGPTWKMTVRVETPEGNWRCWGTIPNSVWGELSAEQLKGRTIEFTATLEAGETDPAFAFFKRPSGARLV